MYRLYTEDVNRSRIESILQSQTDGYTFVSAHRVYKGIKEDTLIVELADVTHDVAARIAEMIAVANHQESVMMIWLPVETSFVTANSERFPMYE